MDFIGALIRRLLLLLNILSLDAPLVTVIWCSYLSAEYDRNVSQAELLILFFVTWLAYSGDRLLDAVRIPTDEITRPRYRFAKAYVREWFACWGCLFIITALLVVQTISWEQIMIGIMLAGIVGCYFAICQRWSRFRFWLPRELAVAVIVVGGVIYFPLSHLGQPASGFWYASLGMVFLTLANGMGIACWEYSEDCRIGEVSIATSWPALIEIYGIAVSLLGLLILSYGFSLDGDVTAILIRVGVSCLLLGLINQMKKSQNIRPTLADLSIALPFLF